MGRRRSKRKVRRNRTENKKEETSRDQRSRKPIKRGKGSNNIKDENGEENEIENRRKQVDDSRKKDA